MKPALSIDIKASPITSSGREQYHAMESVDSHKAQHQSTTPELEPIPPATINSTKIKSRWITRLKSWLPAVVPWGKPKSEPLTPLA